MIRKEQQGTLLKRTVTPNSYNEQVVTWTAQATPIAIIISYTANAFTTTNDVLAARYTISGLTFDNRVNESDKITVDNKTYLVETIVNSGKRRICTLIEDKAID